MAAMSSISSVLNFLETIKNFMARYVSQLRWRRHFPNLVSFYTAQFDLQNFRTILVYHLIIDILDPTLGHRIQKDALSSFI